MDSDCAEITASAVYADYAAYTVSAIYAAKAALSQVLAKPFVRQSQCLPRTSDLENQEPHFATRSNLAAGST